MAKSSSIVLFLLVLLFVGGLQLCFCKNSTFGCIKREREALLQLKQSFNDSFNRLVSWTGNDCCLWNAVSCNQITGRVVKLDLRAPVSPFNEYEWGYEYFSYVDQYKGLFATKVDSCLVELKRLEYLDLSGNDFNQSPIPEFFGSLKHLKYLNLSRAGFGGRIPAQLGNLTSLQILDLSYEYYWALYADNFQWVLGLSSLKHLEMRYVNLSNALDVMQVLNTLPSLIYLGLNECGIQNVHFPHGSPNSSFLTSVQFLSLRYNSLTGPIPNVIQNMTALRELDLSYQGRYYYSNGGLYVDNLQWFSRLSSLEHLDMSGANLTKALDVMQVLNKLPSLIYLGLNDCGIRNIHFPRGSLNSTFLRSVQFLSLSRNALTGPIPSIQNMTSLRELDLSYQGWYYYSSGGGIYVDNLQWFSGLSSLQHLDMTGTNLTKALDVMQVLNKLPSLVYLGLHYCGIQNIHFPRGSLNSTFLRSVQFLRLSENGLTGPIPNALQNMTAVRVLDLWGNYFNSTIPLSLVNSKSLVDLNLGWNEFETIEGAMLSILNKACSLRSLDLSRNSFLSDVLESNKNSSRCLVYHLEYLSLTYGGISGDLPDYLGQLKGLKELYLAGNSFYGPIPSSLGELSALRSLHLENNQLNGTIPQSLGRLSTLQELDLSNNTLQGIIPQSLGRLSSLNRLYLSHNQLTGSIPDSLGQLVNLVEFDIASNSLEGVISERTFSNLSKLKHLDISSNHLTCNVKSDWVPPFSLDHINMSSCRIRSEFPRWLQTQKEISKLDMSNAGISGGFPVWLCNMSYLSYLDLSTNQMSGNLPTCDVDNFHSLEVLRLGSNLINGSMSSTMCKLENLKLLDLSKNNLSGEIPDCWGRQQGLFLINLSSNKFIGTIPSSIGNLSFLSWLHLDDNSLHGELPLALSDCTSLELLDLGENKISGNIPSWVGESLLLLRILKLRNNTFSGSIPSQLCRLSKLQILDLALNNLSGRIPHCFGKLTGMTKDNDEPEHNITLAFGPVASAPSLAITRVPTPSIVEPASEPPSALTSTPAMSPVASVDEDTEWHKEKVSVVMKGATLEYTTTLLLVDSMDLSRNKLVGCIPEELGALSGLRNLNLSHNHLSGNIPNSIGQLKLIESLDLSDNQLFGAIPQGLGTLTYINHLNLSYNDLSGRIPKGNQLQTLENPTSIYAGNVQLCGEPLQKKCPGDDDAVQPPTSNDHEDEDHGEDKKEKILFYFVVLAGYATGLWGVIGTLVFKRDWRVAYFRFVESTKDRIIVVVAVKVARLKKRMQRTTNEE